MLHIFFTQILVKFSNFFKTIKNLFKRFLIGSKKGLFTSTLPANIINIQQHVFCRILRVLGGISLLIIFSNKLPTLFSGSLYYTSLYISLLLSILFFIYHLFISYHKIKHIYKLLNSDKLNIHNKE